MCPNGPYLTPMLLPLRFGIRYRPPSLAMEFRERDTVQVLEMALSHVSATSSPDEIFNELQKEHDKHLSPNLVSVTQVKRLLQMLIDSKSTEFVEHKDAGSAPAVADEPRAAAVAESKLDERTESDDGFDEDFADEEEDDAADLLNTTQIAFPQPPDDDVDGSIEEIEEIEEDYGDDGSDFEFDALEEGSDEGYTFD